METCALVVALGAFTIALIALVRTIRHRPGLLAESSDGRRPRRAPDERRDGGRGTADGERRVLVLDPVARVRPPAPRGRWLQWVPRGCAAAVVAIVVVTFALQNTHAVSLRFLDWRFEGLPLAAAILVCGLVAGAAVAAGALLQRRALLARIRRLEAHLRERGPSSRRGHRHAGTGPTPGTRYLSPRAVAGKPWIDAASDPA